MFFIVQYFFKLITRSFRVCTARLLLLLSLNSRLLIYCSLLAFVLLLSLKWDGYVDADYWLVFSPLWLWKLVAVSSTLAASYLWHRQPQYRMDQEALLEYKAMMMCVSLHLLLLVFEVLLCDNLETPARY